MNIRENVCDHYNHFFDDNPINVVMVGESYWSGNACVERQMSDLTAIELVLDGKGFLENNGKLYELVPGDAFILRKGTKHKYYNAKGEKLHKLFITLSGDLPEILLNYYLPTHDYVYHNCDVEQLLRNMLDVAKKHGKDYNAFVDDSMPLLMRILIQISHCQSNYSADIADEMREFLDAQIDKSFSLDDLCNKFGYSKNHIINKFAEKFEITPYQYYTNKKFETVKLYLLNTSFTLAEIAEKLSFSDQQYFSSWFKSVSGTSPSQFRKSNGRL